MLYRTRNVRDRKALKICFFFIHSYLNYGNIVWTSTSKAKLKKTSEKAQKQALRIVNKEYTDIREIVVRKKVLNTYKLKIYQISIFMIKRKTNTIRRIFGSQFMEIYHQCSTRFSKNSFVENQLAYSQTKFLVSLRGPRLWNKLLGQQQKSQ